MNYTSCILRFLLAVFLLPNTGSHAEDIVTGSNNQSLQQFINDCLEASVGEILIPEGTYHIDETITVSGVENVTIQGSGAGAELIFTARTTAFQILDSKGITLSNLSIDYDPLHFSQGKIVRIGENGLWYEVGIFEGYRNGDSLLELMGLGRPMMIIMDPENRSIKRNVRDQYYAESVEKISDDLFRLNFESPTDSQHAVEVGDYVVLRVRGGGNVLNLENVEESHFEDIAIYSGPGMGIREERCSGNIYQNILITPGEKPEGASLERYFSINADGFHSKFAEKGPVIENCFFELMGDDAVNIGGSMGFILGNSGNRIYISPKSEDLYHAGSKVQIADGQNFSIRGEYHIKDVRIVKNPEASMVSSANELWEGHHSQRADVSHILEVVLAEPVEARTGDIATGLDRMGAGAIVRNNTFRGHRARGILIKAHDSLIEGNTFEDISMVAISVTPEYYWMEGPFPRNVRIRNNRFRNIGLSEKGSLGGNRLGTISVFIDSWSRGRTYAVQSRGIRDIFIEGNYFEDPAFAAIMLKNTTGAHIAGNVIQNSPRISEEVRAVADTVELLSSGIYIYDTDNIEIDNNIIRHVPQYGMFIQSSDHISLSGANRIISFFSDEIEENASILRLEGVENITVEGLRYVDPQKKLNKPY